MAYASRRSPVFARNVVATSQPLATQAGLAILRAGGNAVDAALATAIALAVVEPCSNGVGSDLFAIVWDGSELADRYLACLAAYADVTYVDKRTHEASRQARQKSKVFASLVHRIEKAGEYGKIAGQLSTQFGTQPTEAPSILD